MADITFEQVKPLIEQMPSIELDRLRAWLNDPDQRSQSASDTLSWGQRLVALVDQFDFNEADQMNITDPESWVREQRRTQTQKRNPEWGVE